MVTKNDGAAHAAIKEDKVLEALRESFLVSAKETPAVYVNYCNAGIVSEEDQAFIADAIRQEAIKAQRGAVKKFFRSEENLPANADELLDTFLANQNENMSIARTLFRRETDNRGGGATVKYEAAFKTPENETVLFSIRKSAASK